MEEIIDKKIYKVLIIDDDISIMEMLSMMLKKYNCDVTTYTEPVSAIEELKNNKYDILILNFLMIPVNGDKIVELVREFDKEIYIILMSTHNDLAPSIELMKKLDIQAYFEKSSRFDELIMLVQGGIKYIEQLNRIKEMNMQLDKNLIEFAKILLNTISAKDNYTKDHSQNVSKLCVMFANYLNLSEDDVENLRIAALFHDIGKIGIPDNILQKEGKLTNTEYETIKLHPVIGANIFSSTDIFKHIAPIIVAHHERVDGTGYPNNLKGNEIPYLAKILTICDCFDAMVSKRSYKEKMTIEYAIEQLNKGAGTQFDKELVDSFIKLINEKRDIFEEIYK
ncbi:MAG: HD domain-containing protein [Bacilli bacterium]|nr:HD domain-containing protein [Bacilli bacterium]